jgi:dTDP-4-dehydrorhamnose reductase
MNVLIVGADGMIGRALAEALTTDNRTIFETTRRPGAAGTRRILLDLASDPSDVPLPDPLSVAYLCAAVTSVQDCERDPEGTARINVVHTLALARRLNQRGARLVFLSTNIVFDGLKGFARAEDAAAPRCVYGRQKLAVEQELLRLNRANSIVRLTKVLGPNPPLFLEWLRRLRSGQPVEPFRDKVMSPVPLSFVIEVLRRLGDGNQGGILQVSGSRDVAYADIALHLALRVGAPSSLVRPVDGRTRLADAALAPDHTTLDTGRLERDLGLRAPDVWQTIDGSLT